MNFKKSWKRFFSLSNRNDGFTLVELIVVIAILAILAGVAVPAYSGYIKKAEKAADLQLLGAVNTAFAAAALENGDDVNTLTSADMPLTGSEGARTVNADGIRPAEYQAAFKRYFAGNEGSAFKAIAGLEFVDGAFAESGSFTGSWGGGNITVSEAFREAWTGSTFEDMGMSTMLGQVNNASGLAAFLMTGTNGTNYKKLLNQGEYMNNMLAAFGIDDISTPEGQQAYSTMMGNLVSAKALELSGANVDGWDTMTDEQKAAHWNNLDATQRSAFNNNANNLILANNAILTAVSNTTTDATVLKQNISNGLTETQIENLKTTGDTQTLSTAAAMYTMYIAYANTEEGKNAGADASINNGLTQALLTASGDKNFQDYLKGPQADADLKAYMETMNTVSSNASDPTVAQSLLLNGFGDSDLATLLQGAVS